MAKTELGVKRLCLSCGAKFYDFDKEDIECPSCGAAFDPEAAMKLKRGRSPANDDKPVEEKPVAETESDDDDIDLEDDDEDVLEDTSDLDDDDDVPGVPGVSDDDET